MNRLLKRTIIFAFLLSACTHYYAPKTIHSSHNELTQIKDDSLTVVKIAPYKKQLDAQMNEVIASCDSTLTKDGMESTLANFVMQAVEHFSNAHKPELKNKILPMVNRGGLRINLPKGEISVRTIYELMPFDNELVYITITGTKLQEAVTSFCENGKLFNAHLSFRIENKTPIDLKIYNENWNDKNQYTILTTDYLANGGDNLNCFNLPLKLETTGIKLRDAIIDYCRYLTKNNTHILPYKDGRITISK